MTGSRCERSPLRKGCPATDQVIAAARLLKIVVRTAPSICTAQNKVRVPIVEPSGLKLRTTSPDRAAKAIGLPTNIPKVNLALAPTNVHFVCALHQPTLPRASPGRARQRSRITLEGEAFEGRLVLKGRARICWRIVRLIAEHRPILTRHLYLLRDNFAAQCLSARHHRGRKAL